MTNITIDGNGAAHNGKGLAAGGGQFAEARTGEQPDNVDLSRGAEKVLRPSRALVGATREMNARTAAVQAREDLQESLIQLREINPNIGSIELCDQGQDGGAYAFVAAWDKDGNDISEYDWFGDGKVVGIEELERDEDRFPILDRLYDYDGSHLTGLATVNDEHLAWNVDVDEALAANATDPAATTFRERVLAISWASRDLAAALEKVKLSEAHEYLNEIDKLGPELPAEVDSIQLVEATDDIGDGFTLIVDLLDSEGKSVRPEAGAASQAATLAYMIQSPLYDLQSRGSFHTDDMDNNLLTIKVKR